MEQTYLFYDLETSGLNKCFDQIIQFAAIRTDNKFNILETDNFNVSLRDDVVISPEALLVHKTSPKKLRGGKSEYEAVFEIHKMLNTPGTISLGYNTLGFDDEFLRFSFYRNLLAPYTHQFKNNCFRMDIYPMAVFYYLFSNHVVSWPYKENKISLKLEKLAALNDLTKGSAHDALADVEATLNLAKKFLNEKDVWKYLSDFFVKSFDKKRCDLLGELFQSESGIHKFGIFVDGKIGKDSSFMAPFLLLGNSIPYSNQSIWLRLDRENIKELDFENIEENSFVIRKKFGEPPFLLPPYERFLKRMDGDLLELARENIEFLKGKKQLFTKLVNFHKNYRYPEIENIDADASLYSRGFMSDKELHKCMEFHNAKDRDKLKKIDSLDEINQELAKRVIFRNDAFKPSKEILENKKDYFNSLTSKNEQDYPIDYMGNSKLSPKEGLLKIEELFKTDLDENDVNLLKELKADIVDRFKM